MTSLIHQRCFNHSGREAAARCTECKSFFCRECVSEHDGRLECAACLARLREARAAHRRDFKGVRRLIELAAGILVIWLTFYACGQLLLLLPASFHEGTLWLEDLMEAKP